MSSSVREWWNRKVLVIACVALNTMGFLVFLLDVFEDALPELWIDEVAGLIATVVAFFLTRAMRQGYARTRFQTARQWVISGLFALAWIIDLLSRSGSVADELFLALVVFVIIPLLTWGPHLFPRLKVFAPVHSHFK